MNSHDEFRELAALRLYGELDASERARLAQHVLQCEECSALERELDAGLGRLVETTHHDDLPRGWRGRIEAALVAPPPWAKLRSRSWIAAASFLFGAILAWSLASTVLRPAEAQPDRSSATAERSTFERSTPPPLAREGVSLPPLAELYLRR